jgi:plastocyanin
MLLALPGQASAAEFVGTTPPPAEHRADPALGTHVYRLGPFSVGPYQAVRRADPALPPAVEGSIVGMDARIVDEAGGEIPQSEVMLHHLVFMNRGPGDDRRDGACPEREGARERFFGTSEELRAMTLPRGYGYPTSASDTWKAIWMVMNHRSDVRRFFIEYRVTIDPSPAIQAVKPYWLSVLSCDRSPDPQYSVPGGRRAGASHVRTREWPAPIDGRIVAVGGHLHGGGRSLALTQTGCDGRELFTSRPTYAPAGDPLYSVFPLLHEPDPTNMSWFQSAGGWGVRRGERLRVSASYEGSRPHMRVMGIAHVYIAPGAPAGVACTPPPPDPEVLGAGFAGRDEPPSVKLTLASFRPGGSARPISRPPGRVIRVEGDQRVVVDRFSFSRPNLAVPLGSRVSWRFQDAVLHDVTLASGPEGFASPQLRGGRVYRKRFDVPGKYRLYCSFHPTAMSQYVRVGPRGRRRG